MNQQLEELANMTSTSLRDLGFFLISYFIRWFDVVAHPLIFITNIAQMSQAMRSTVFLLCFLLN